jgi:hypothetical protein
MEVSVRVTTKREHGLLMLYTKLTILILRQDAMRRISMERAAQISVPK